MSTSGRIRVRCDGVPQHALVTAVDEDGVETPLEGVVRSIVWRAANDGELATAVIEFEQVEIDAVGEVRPR